MENKELQYYLTDEDRKIIQTATEEFEQEGRKSQMLLYPKKKNQIKLGTRTLTQNTAKDLFNEIPRYQKKTKKEEHKILKLLKLSYFPNAKAEDKILDIKYFAEVQPWFMEVFKENLTEEQQDIAFNKALTISKEARDAFISENIFLAAAIARKYDTPIPFEDLIEQGVIGLIDAAERFDISKGNKFSTYASLRVQLEITRFVDVNSSSINKNVYFAQKIKKIMDAENSLNNLLKRMPTDKELAEYLNMSEHKIRKFKSSNTVVTSIDASVSKDFEKSIDEIYADENMLDNPEIVNEIMLMEEFYKIFENVRIDKRARQIVCEYYGLYGQPTKSTIEISQEHGISKSNVWKINRDVLKKLKEPFKNLNENINYNLLDKTIELVNIKRK